MVTIAIVAQIYRHGPCGHRRAIPAEFSLIALRLARPVLHRCVRVTPVMVVTWTAMAMALDASKVQPQVLEADAGIFDGLNS